MYKSLTLAMNDFEKIEVKEMSDWKGGFHEDFKPGDFVTGEVVWELIDAVPPLNFSSNYFQCGEPTSHKQKENGMFAPTFLTFSKVLSDPEIWRYHGAVWAGSMEDEK